MSSVGKTHGDGGSVGNSLGEPERFLLH
jgi:hypothetical protein